MSKSAQTPPLHPIERAFLSGLAASKDEWLDIETSAERAKLSLDQTRRALEWLKPKGLVEAREEERLSYLLGKEGQVAAKEGLPERKIVNFLKARRGTVPIDVVSRALGSEFSVAFGRARKNHWIEVSDNQIRLGKNFETKENEEVVLEKIAESAGIGSGDLSKPEMETLEALRKRHKGLIEEKREKRVFVKISQSGLQVSKTALIEQIDAITPQVLQTGDWKRLPLRALDVTSPAPNLFPGRRHPMRLFMDEVRETFVSLGFEEIVGPMCQSSLWNFDALFIPQQHSAREMQDTFYLGRLKANIRSFEKEIESIKAAHENGGNTGSLGWQYEWRREEASRVVLRTHTTAVTISYLARQKPEEARVFSVGRVFRNEKPNYKHNPEFYQIEGVMVGKELNLSNLIYIISKFYSKLGFHKIKFWPTYFPYTEPSLQTMAFYEPAQAWMELGGMGVFRPEVTLPLGVKNLVLAWGLSLDRLVMLRYNVTDIRDLFGANLDWLRNVRVS